MRPPSAAQLESLQFSFLTPSQVEQLSVVRIASPIVFDRLGHPQKGGLYDPALGPLTERDRCSTCHLDYTNCPGHYGHITLPLPCYNPLVLPQLLLLLKAVCVHCHRFRLSPSDLPHRISPSNKRLILSFLRTTASRTECEHCNARSPRFRLVSHSKILKFTSLSNSQPAYMPPSDVHSILTRLFEQEKVVLSSFYSTPDMFFLFNIAVPPTKFRPASKMGADTFENVQNDLLLKILHSCDSIVTQTHNSSNKPLESLVNAIIQLQVDINCFFDCSKNPIPLKHPPPGIKQLLEKKDGLFRRHMMGKRVNYSARSVISPDPYIETAEIGVPPVFAAKLTYPEPVTSFNVHQLRSAVINGPAWPGASHILNDDGKLTSLKHLPVEKRTALANQLLTPTLSNSPTNKVVYRHLQTGDLLLLNRQPTLHKPSIMAHKARVLKGEKTIRLHYANCNAYNADFDGDEMNIHFPQNDTARAEALLIADTDSQYLAPTNGKPLRGLIQDHIVAGVWMTSRDSFFTRDDYQQLLASSLPLQTRVSTISPAILKPVPLWTGKQIISTVMLNLKPPGRPGLNLLSKSQVAARYWGPDSEEDQVVVRDGHLLVGILDKSQFGASPYGLTHSIHEIYDPETAGKLLSVLGRLFTNYAQLRGFTCRIDDLLLSPQGDLTRTNTIQSGQHFGPNVAQEYLNVQTDEQLHLRMEQVIRDDEQLAGLDSAMKSKMGSLTSLVINDCLPTCLLRQFPQNNMQMMTVSGAKGSNVNVSQISCLLGQQELEGRRVPVMASGKTLPSFKPFDTRAVAGGYITSRFLTGIKPQEYFFHCMAGREGLIDTAVKTSRSGYLQRCLIKHLEGIRVHYDHTVRDSDGKLIQFLYGEDSLDVVKSQHLLKFGFAALNHKSLVQKYNPQGSLASLDAEKAWPYAKKALKHPKKYDPVLSVYNPSRYLGSVSESFHKDLEEYLEKNEDRLIKRKDNYSRATFNTTNQVSRKHFRALMQLKYIKSLVEPGEAVGVLAGQSIGEPSTQMTLNTFHFAGFGAKNVTLGIPRLREIIMTASVNIKTPTMTLKLLDSVSNDVAHQFCKSNSRLVLSQIVDTVSVLERIAAKKIYTIRLNFFPREEYELEYGISASNIKSICSTPFLVNLESTISKHVRQATKLADIGVSKKRDNHQEERGEDSDEETKRERATYDDPDEEEQLIIQDQISSDHESSDSPVGELDNAGTRDIPARSTNVTRWTFDSNGQWLEIELQYPHDLPKLLIINIIEQVCRETVVREMKQVTRCFRLQSKLDTQRLLATEGVNFKEMWQHDHIIDPCSIYSNDIAAILTTYGVEAARQAIIKEVSGVFKVYGITVDLRHLTLIADYMTFEGGYRAFNRIALERNVSPLLKMSFETTCHFLTSAALYGEYDTLQSPSACLVTGKVTKLGTGSFDILTPINVY